MIKLTIIGYGKLAKCLVKGFIKNKKIELRILSPSFTKFTPTELNKIKCSALNTKYIDDADLILLAVKPNIISTVVNEIAPYINTRSCLISVAAGIEIKTIEKHFNIKVSIVRAMPNTSAAIKQSPTALYKNKNCSKTHKEMVNNLFLLIGKTIWIDKESNLDVLTALIGSGPAFVYEFINELSKASQLLGLDKKHANIISSQMVVGASNLALTQPNEIVALQNHVISKGGTTEAGLEALRESGFAKAICSAINKSTMRAKELK